MKFTLGLSVVLTLCAFSVSANTSDTMTSNSSSTYGNGTMTDTTNNPLNDNSVLTPDQQAGTAASETTSRTTVRKHKKRMRKDNMSRPDKMGNPNTSDSTSTSRSETTTETPGNSSDSTDANSPSANP